MKKLFWDDPYLTECRATVTKSSGNVVELDQSIFFAFSGGQASDTGTINGIPVINATSGDTIQYELETNPLKEGDRVTVKIDEDFRKRVTHLHSAVHIAEFLFWKKYGTQERIGSNIDDKKGRLDYAIAEPITERLPEIEQEANALISQHITIQRFERDGRMIWQLESIHNSDVECGGTHPRNTSEIGPIKLKRKNIGKGKERIEIYLAA